MTEHLDRGALLCKRDNLLKRIDDIKRDLGQGLDPDLNEQAIQLENMEVLQELLNVATTELEEVATQLATSRIDNGSG